MNQEVRRGWGWHEAPTKRCPQTGGHFNCGHALPLSSKPVKRGKPPRARRATPRRQSGKCPELLAWLREQPCFVTGKRTSELAVVSLTPATLTQVVVESAHLPRVKLWGDINNALPLALHLHRRQHQKGRETFASEIGHTLESLQVLATGYTDRFFRLHPEIAVKYGRSAVVEGYSQEEEGS